MPAYAGSTRRLVIDRASLFQSVTTVNSAKIISVADAPASFVVRLSMFSQRKNFIRRISCYMAMIKYIGPENHKHNDIHCYLLQDAYRIPAMFSRALPYWYKTEPPALMCSGSYRAVTLTVVVVPCITQRL